MESLFSQWRLDGLMAVFLICILVVYSVMVRFRTTDRFVYFFAGFVLVILCVASPLRFLGENYLMSAHMVSHVVLLLIAAPLMVMGIPAENPKRVLIHISERLSKWPWMAWITGVCIMWFWHIPLVSNELFANMHTTSGRFFSLTLLQDVHLISLILAGIIFSWTIIGPVPEKRLSPLNAVLYLSAACVFCSILGLLITFAPSGVYTRYIMPGDPFDLMNRIRNQHGITAQIDQQVAGLIMWVPGCLIYLSASIGLLMKWFRERNGTSVYLSSNNNPQDGK